jgi:hypothetical protein
MVAGWGRGVTGGRVAEERFRDDPDGNALELTERTTLWDAHSCRRVMGDRVIGLWAVEGSTMRGSKPTPRRLD